jgi:predicted DNA-binding transcriptional regulator YafY
MRRPKNLLIEYTSFYLFCSGSQPLLARQSIPMTLVFLVFFAYTYYAFVNSLLFRDGGQIFMRADRLLSILMLLQSKGRMTAHDLATQLEVSERTIYRDLEALSIAGVPIYTERGPGGGCELMAGYQTRLTGLTESEVRALFLAHLTAPLADLGLDQALDQAMLKLSATLPAPSLHSAEHIRQRVHFDASWWHHGDDATHCLHTIQEAVWQDRQLKLAYLEDDGAQSELRCEAYGLVAKAHVWYLVGSCTAHIRVLRVSRIQHALLLEELFKRPADFDLASFWTTYCTEVEAHPSQYAIALRLAPEEAPRIHETLHTWGYMLVESEESVFDQGTSIANHAMLRPSRFRQQKKALPVHIKPVIRRKIKNGRTLYKKNQFRNKKKPCMLPDKKKAAAYTTKKTAFQQKKGFNRSIKKTNFLPLKPHTLLHCA